jgi:HAD superfamily hydrolase (TIGR01509 family)
MPTDSSNGPAALIFDCDGTLVDTMPLHWQVWQQLLPKYGLRLSAERFYAMGGVPSRELVRLLAQEQGVSVDPLAFEAEKEQGYLALLSLVKPIPEVVRIAQAHAGRLPMAVASGGSRRVIQTVLRHVGLRHLFRVLVTHEDVQRQKPAPDIFLEAARRLGVPPARCRAYEDTDVGLAAIRAAGMEAVDVRMLRQQPALAGPLP